MKALLVLLALVLSMGACSPAGEADDSRNPIIPAVY